MEIEGRIVLVLPERSGVSRAGNSWKAREYVLETKETYPRKIMFDFFGDKADQYVLNMGDEIRLSFDIESREYNGRWFTSIRGWKSEPLVAQQPGQPMGGPMMGAPAMGANLGSVPPPPPVSPGNEEDLPF